MMMQLWNSGDAPHAYAPWSREKRFVIFFKPNSSISFARWALVPLPTHRTPPRVHGPRRSIQGCNVIMIATITLSITVNLD